MVLLEVEPGHVPVWKVPTLFYLIYLLGVKLRNLTSKSPVPRNDKNPLSPSEEPKLTGRKGLEKRP